MPLFRVGITPDFFVEAKGRFEAALNSRLSNVPGLEYAPMPPQPGNVATAEVLNEFDAIFALALKFTADSLRGVERLALVARWGVGYDMIDVQALTQNNIALAITPKAVKRPVAEAILTLVFALAKDLTAQDGVVRSGGWRGNLRRLGFGITGKTLGSIGCGNIAREMFRMAASLGFGRFVAHDPNVSEQEARSVGAELVTIEEVLSDSDFVTVNTLLNESTRGLIGESQLRLMKRTAFLINTARGPIVDERALVRALRENWIAGAGIDVFEKEPIGQDNPLLSMDNVILSPHGLAWTEEIVRDNGHEACDNILQLARGEVPDGLVNREVLSRAGFHAKLAHYRAQAIRSNA